MTWDRANVYSDSLVRIIHAMRKTADNNRYVDKKDNASMQTRISLPTAFFTLLLFMQTLSDVGQIAPNA